MKKKPIIFQELIIKAPNRRPWDVGDWRQALRSADRGKVAPLYDLYEDMLVDTTLADALDKRTQAVVNADITFLDKDGQEVDLLKDLIDTEEFEALQRLIMKARLLGRSAVEFGWTNEGLTVSEIPPKHLDLEHQQILLDPTDDKGISYLEDPYLMVLGKPRDYGVILRAIPFAIYKRGGFGDWAQWIELFGMPQRVGKYNTYDPESKRQLEQAMERAGSAPWMVIPKEADVEMRESSASNGISFKQFVDACNQEMLVGILGQTLTTVSGERGARSLGEVHQEVEEAKNKSDMRYLQRILNRHFLPFLELQGLPVNGGRFAYPQSTEPVSVTDLATLSTMMTIPREWLHDRFGIPMPEADEEKESKEEKEEDRDEEQDSEEQEAEFSKSPSSAKSAKTKRGLASFFVHAPHLVGQTQSRLVTLWRKWTHSTLRKIELDDEGTTIDLEDLLSEALREVYGDAKNNPPKPKDKQPIADSDSLSPSLFEANNQPMQQALSVAFDASSFGSPEPAFEYELRYNMAVWSAFKTHREMEDLAGLLVRPDGRLRSFAEFRKLAQPIIGKYNVQWLRTEYNSAVLKARSAVQFKEALKTKDLYPNLEYLQSSSVHKRQDHLAYVGTILPIEHSFWEEHLPPLDWNCKCRVRPTDKGATAVPPTAPKDKPKAGLGSNPAKSGSVFDLKQHPYTHNAGIPTCPECRRQGLLSRSRLTDDDSQLCPMHKRAKETIKRVERARRKAKNKEIREWAYDKIPEGGITISNKRFATGKVEVYRAGVNSIAKHFTSLELKEIAKDIFEVLEKAQFTHKSELDKDSHNYVKKVIKGVEGYTYYKLVHKGFNLVLTMELIEGKERPYALTLKQ
ncbi:MAG: DUF935 family protein [Porphyromonas sp.]|uniref:phage portal protein family protein n=1 Tax=Porphyromonas sp. TaxID=1924944 RepID=UPI002A747694|nr:DUF935 family protein [Porphyromonas sp.]MDY3112177.1 DUF935 family protein [Porphyromonas sp.]